VHLLRGWDQRGGGCVLAVDVGSRSETVLFVLPKLLFPVAAAPSQITSSSTSMHCSLHH
jgi:hypothetical protein